MITRRIGYGVSSCLILLSLAFAPSSASTTATLGGADGLKVREQDAPGAVALVSGDSAATIYADAGDLQPTGIATALFAEDVRRVTGRAPRVVSRPEDLSGDAVLVGTIGHSALIDQLIAERKVDVADVKDRWECYAIQVIDHPLPNVRRALAIVGSDRRGTAYGVFTVSRAIGVSPWYWWADVPVARKSSLFVLPGRVKDGPVVKYRGIFLNDEAPAMSGWAHEKFGGFNSKMYVHVFELLLRLKANYLWPAMWGNAFNEDDPQNPKLANDYGIVMGTSHQEPMLRAQAEFDHRYKPAEWNYATHPGLMERFWREGIRRNKDYESLITIGMRGRNDTEMIEGATLQQSTGLLEKIVARQRQILVEEMNRPIEQIPQMWCLYKEVQGYYEHGLRVPDDVTLLWSDDNWGDLRRLPTPEERQRRGGAGIYYHFDYVGDPRNYKWINTNCVPKVWEQMNLAWRYGADRVWIVNVGDLKPMEFPIDFFLSMAWAPARFTANDLPQWGRRWAAEQFGPEHAAQIADVIAKYTRYNGRRKPELIDPSTFSLVNYDEADRVVAEWKAAVAKAEQIGSELPPQMRDAYYQLVLYPTKACAVVTELYVAAGRNRLYASQGRASTNDWADRVRALFKEDAELAAAYNHTIAGGKWDHMMDQTHIGYTSWQDPKTNVMPAVKELETPEAASMAVAVEGSDSAWPGGSGEPAIPIVDRFNRQRRWVDVFNRGRTAFDFTAKASAPWIVLSDASGRVDKEHRLWIGVDWAKAPQGAAEGQVTIAGTGGDPVVVRVSAFNPPRPGQAFAGFVESNGCVSIEAEHFARQVDGEDVHWQIIPDYGRTLSAVTTLPATAPSREPSDGGKGPCLEYPIYTFDAGKVDVAAILAPTLDFVPGRGLRYAVSFDDQPPQVVNALAKNSHQDWQRAVSDGVREVHNTLSIDEPGTHTLKFWRVDPAVVLEKLVVNFGGVRPSYLGPPESFRQGDVRGDGAAFPAGATLRGAVNGRFLIGAAVMSRQLDDARTAALVARQFDCLTAENEFKPQELEPEPGRFEFAAADKIIDFARQHQMKVIGHNLCWHRQTPKWMFQGPDGRPLSRDEALRNLKAHIDGVVGHFKGKVLGWDVVNEAISDKPGEFLRDTPARRAIGDDYIARAFEFAHAADPDAELYYNDFSDEEPAKREKTIRLVRALRDKGLRIDAVGIQCHLRLQDAAAPQALDQAIAAYAGAGVKVAISELDVDVLPRATVAAEVAARERFGANPYPHGLPADVAQAQAKYYAELFRAILKHTGQVTRVTFWGVQDGHSWLNDWPIWHRTNYPLLFDRDLRPKPAFGAVLDVLTTPAGGKQEGRPSRSAAVPEPRTDANSRIAHEQLLAKAKAGGIDLYFLGDSITRRWGCTDPQWAPMLANWKKNFFGWNAADFGWGADGIQNILWRIQNGELDGVNPKVIVILAGTNNIGARPGGDEKVADIVAGIRALVETCHEKAPGAKIILTAIFPRNDSLAVWPEIRRVNQGIEKLADGKTVFYVNVNDKLANADGVLFEGMTVDKLHPAAKGFQVWADGLRPLLLRFLGPPAQTDHAPAPTGDPSAVKAPYRP
jgi:GH35 family endo-1,4-beta-xylanase/lysophospholipase L1-like esterase